MCMRDTNPIYIISRSNFKFLNKLRRIDKKYYIW